MVISLKKVSNVCSGSDVTEEAMDLIKPKNFVTEGYGVKEACNSDRA